MSTAIGAGNTTAIDQLFQKNLQDLIKGIRSHKKDLSEYVSQAISEVKIELKSTDVFTKAEAVRKLTYIQMLGFNVDWASFSIVEVMSQTRFAHKRIGYLAANQIFNEATDVILLTTNLFKKEFTNINSGPYEIGMAVNCLANIATKELARDCLSDIVTLINNNRPYIRKKAILAIYKLYIKYPQGLRLTFDNLKERLDDSDMSVTSTAVNVICELANRNPNNYLGLAPKFFKFLSTSSNNWMLIKVVKLLTSLVPEEPRLARKLLDPLANIVQNTGAKSLQYECIYALTESLHYSKRDDGSEPKNAQQIIKLCADHLKEFIMDNDQNLKYLGLVGMYNLMKSGNNSSNSTSVRAVLEHRDLILRCLYDEDMTIRMKAIELLTGFVTKNSLMELVKHFLLHAKQAEGKFRDEIISKVLYICKRDKYSMITDFAWLVDTLLEMATLQSCSYGREIAEQLIDIALRVQPLRPYAVERMLTLLFNDSLVLGQARSSVSEVLRAAAWIIGEYSEVITSISRDNYESLHDDDDEEDDVSDESNENAFWILAEGGEEVRSQFRGQHQLHCMVLSALLHAKITHLLPHIQAIFLHASMKLMIRSFHDCDAEEIADIIAVLRTSLPLFLQNSDMEVQERASTLRSLLAEMDILPIDWEETLKKQQENTTEKNHPKSNNTMSLLDFMPNYSLNSVRGVDERGAKIAQSQATILLKSILHEKFYAVHPKAQRKVPVPEDLDLDAAFHTSALSKIMNMELCSNDLSLSALRLVKDTFNYNNNNNISSSTNTSATRPTPFYEDEPRESNKLSTSNSQHTQSNDNASFASGVTTKNSNEDSIFMLSSKPSQEMNVNPLSKILGDTLEEHTQQQNPSSGRRRDKHYSSSHDKQRKKSKALQRVQVDVSEALPVNETAKKSNDLLQLMNNDDQRLELEDEDNDGDNNRSQRNRSSKKNSRKSKSSNEADTLEDVDITTPLAANEVIYVPTHRTVTNNMNASEEKKKISSTDVSNTETKTSQKKKEKKNKESSDRDGKKSKKKEKKSRSEESSDLLNLLDIPASTATSETPQRVETSAKKSTEYSIAYNHALLTVSYHIASSLSTKDDDIIEVTIKWNVEARHPSISALQYQIDSQALHPAVIPSSLASNSIQLLPETSSSSVKTKLLVQRKATPCEGFNISGSLVINGMNTGNNTLITLSPFTFCKSSKLEKNEFLEKVTNQKLCKATASITMQVSSSQSASSGSQDIWEKVTHRLCAYVVEVEASPSGNAATLASKSLLLPSTYLFYLAKRKNGTNTVVVDLKVISKKSETSHCKNLLDALIASMENMEI